MSSQQLLLVLLLLELEEIRQREAMIDALEDVIRHLRRGTDLGIDPDG